MYGDKTSYENDISVFMTQNHQNLTISTITIEFGERENCPERQKERADNFLQKSKSFLPWILKGIRPKNFHNSTIFTIAIELGIFERENRPERQKERADNFLHKSKNSLRCILKGNRPKNFQNWTIFINTIELA